MKGSYSEYLKIIERYRQARILHIGDLVLDRFLFGEISRISREAPVLILKYRETINIPGGGANAIHNLLTLGAKVYPIGVIGNDEAGDWLYKFFRDYGVDISGIFRKDDYKTPVKTRILAGSFHSSMKQMLRIDQENEEETTPLSSDEIIKKIEKFISKTDAIVVSDYGYKILLPKVIEYLGFLHKKENIPVFVDSRFNMKSFCNISSITPNISEVEEAYQDVIGDDLSKMDAIANRILEEQSMDALLITRGRLGMSLYEKKKKPVHISVYGSDEVADVTGAGDTVIAVYSLSTACGADFKTAARLSNYAGGLVVMKRGTATVSRKELLSAIKADLKKKKIINNES